MREVRDRPAIRGIVLDEFDRVFLLQIVVDDFGTKLWLTPGGGIELGEDPEVALRRELFEEVGIERPTIGPCVWTREHEFFWKDCWWRALERFHVVRVGDTELGPGAPEPHELDAPRRWFTVDELHRFDETVVPRRLRHLLEQLLEYGEPSEPIDTGE
jgi:8-oxo-dGTP diphosphatase